mgnify:CR=1 FL=1
MYLHIGKDCVINSNDIIGLFNLDYIGNTKEYRNMKAYLQENKMLEDISNNQEKTFILLENNKKINAYILNISVSSIRKRKM